MISLALPNEAVLSFFQFADLKFCEAWALANHQNYSVCQTYINTRFQSAISNNRVIHTINDYEKATLLFKLKIIIRSVDLAAHRSLADFDFKCLIMSRNLNWDSVTTEGNTQGIVKFISDCCLEEIQAAGKTLIEKDDVVLLSANTASSKESGDKNAEELCREFSVELPTAFELFSYHVFTSVQCFAEVEGVKERFAAEMEPIKEEECLMKDLKARYTLEIEGLKEKYLNKCPVWVPTSTPISGKDLQMKAYFSSKEEGDTFKLFHQGKSAKVDCIRGRLQL